MARLVARAKELREQLYPVLKASAFLERGVLTPEEFVAAGDELVYKCPTWAWSGGEGPKRKHYLPDEKQFLVTNNVPCGERCAVLEGSTIESDETDDAWITTSVEGSSRPAAEVGEISTMPAASADLAALEETGLDGADDEAVSREDNILRTRTYDLSITYDKYWQTPRMWLFGYDEQNQPLTQEKVFEDVISDYAKRTVTFEMHPHLSSAHASIHPCKHPNVMKRILDNISRADAPPPSPDQALFIFLKFIQNVVPTINYDFTLEARV
ncbi:autophagocytosis associated protein [Pelagophyceae sp. CCMP2097]|nr:autophagocytosis associated protein [Pelagophyceae sp. CCMP2097]|mmetsp:Transcript_11679/g.39062  ORF Transcript_11679/g.39062 Transcript_11679/m.39062 type:complete len:269 (-) Transcript_11679:173-979(-)